MALYPGALPAAGAASSSSTLAAAGHTSLHNVLADEARAIATKMGTGSSTPTANIVLRGTGAGTSSWGAVVLTTDVSGILPQGNGGTGTTGATGGGSVVYATSPTIVTPTITSPTITGATITTSALTTPTIGDFSNATHTHANAAGGGSLGTGVVIGSMLSTSAILLGYAAITTSATATSPVAAVGLGVTVTIPTGGRTLEIFVYASSVFNGNTGVNTRVTIWDGTVGSGTQLQAAVSSSNVVNAQAPLTCVAYPTPAAGSKTYNVGLEGVGGGTSTMSAAATSPAFIVVKLI